MSISYCMHKRMIYWYKLILYIFHLFLVFSVFLQPGKLLLTEVGIGNPEEVKELDKTKLAPSGGYDSLLVSVTLKVP